MRRAGFKLLLLLAAISVVQAAEPPAVAASGPVRIWGYPALEARFLAWEAEYQESHPDARFENHFTGSDTAMAGLYTAQADVAVLGREATANEVKAFEWVFRYRPLVLEILTGSLDRPGSSPALVFLVAASNPLREITLAQADALFGTERLRGAPAALTAWDQLGLTGEWAGRPIHLYGYDTESNTGCFFRHAVLRDSRKLRWEQLTEFADTRAVRQPTHDAAEKICAALARDPAGIAVASLPPDGIGPGLKVLAVRSEPDSRAILPSETTLVDRSYPLVRPVYAYLNRAPGRPAPAHAAAFLRFVLERAACANPDAAGYLPLDASTARRESAKLQ